MVSTPINQTQTQTQTKKFLLIDDERKLIGLVEERFKNEIKTGKYHFEWASNGEDALKRIRTNHFDLLLVDITMPVMSGFELITKLHQLKFDIPVIIITGNEIDLDYCTQGMRLRAFDLIPKPIQFNLLKDSIEKTLKLHKYYRKLNKDKTEARNFLTDSDMPPHSSTIYKEIRSLDLEQQFKIVMKVIEQEFDSQKIQALQSDLPALLAIAIEDDEYKKELINKDTKRIEQGKIPLAILEKGWIELKDEHYTKKKTGEKVTYNYLLLRWIEDNKKQNFRQLKKPDWQDPIVREKVLAILRKRDWSESDKLKVLKAISKLERKKIEQLFLQEDLKFLQPQSFESTKKMSSLDENSSNRKIFKLY